MSAEALPLDVLAAIGDVADGTRLLGETVQRLLDVIVPAFAHVATIDVVAATGEMRRLGARVDAPRDPQLEAALLARHQSGDTSVGVLRTAAVGESQLLTPITEATLRAIATSEADFEMLCSLHLRETMYVPLSARGRTLGVLACSTRTPERTFTPEDLRFAELLGGRIGLALDNVGLSATVSGLERRLEATLANLAAGIVVREPSGRMVFANAAAAEVLGMANVEEAFSATSEQLMARFDAFDEDGERLDLAALPSARALRGKRPEPMVVRSILRSAGRVRWLLHKATPVFEPDGTLAMAVNVFEDITEAKRAELAQRLLSRVGRELVSSLDYEETLGRIAELAVPELADWCAVSIVAGDVLRQVAVAHVNPEMVERARVWGERHPTRLDNPSGAAEVIRTGRADMAAEITEEMLQAETVTKEQVMLVRAAGMRSLIVVPMAIPGREPFGVLSLIMAESGRTFDADDLAVAEELGRRAAMAVENARLYTERSRVARTLQHSLLPPTLPDIPGFRLASLYRPAGEDADVGGDFYDAFRVMDGWLVVVGDVTGHGAEAAALTSLSRHTLRTAARLLEDPIDVLEQLNLALLERPQLSLVSVCAAALRMVDGQMTADILLAGHPPPYCIHRGQPAAVGRPGPLLGLDGRRGWALTTVRLEPGDLLVLYTDGVIDTMGASERFGEERLAETVAAAADAADAVARIDTALSTFASGPQRDDTAALAIQRVAVEAAAGASSVDEETGSLSRPAGSAYVSSSAAKPRFSQSTASGMCSGSMWWAASDSW